MSLLKPLEVRIDQGEPTISFSAHQLNSAETVSELSANLSELIDAQQSALSAESSTWDTESSMGEATNTVNLDLRDVAWVSSIGLNELIELNRKARSKGIQLVLTNVQSVVREVILLTRLERIIEISWDDSQTTE